LKFSGRSDNHNDKFATGSAIELADREREWAFKTETNGYDVSIDQGP